MVDVFAGSEDFAFDGLGHIVGKANGSIIVADAGGQTTTLATNIATAYGMRFFSNGALAVALPSLGKVIQVTPSGDVTDIASGMANVNGVHVDSQDTLWVTQLSQNSVVAKIPFGGTKQVILSGNDASGANGIYLDEERGQLFYTDYGNGKLRRTDPNNVSVVDIITIAGAKLDGLAMDACGNIYAVDQGSSRIFRVQLDADGNATGPAEMLAQFPKNVANANFGYGDGFDATKLYVAGNPGTVYSIAVGVPGK